MIFFAIFAILSLGLDIVLGLTGLFTLGHAVFFGIGAYASALLALKFGAPFWISIIAAIIVSGILGAILGFPSLRLRGDYLAIATLAYAFIFRMLLINADNVTGGPMGLPNIPRPSILGFYLGSREAYYYLVWTAVLICFLICLRIAKGKMGRAFRAIRDDDDAAEYMGINIVIYKVMAFAIGGAIAGAAGSLYVHYLTFVSPDTFTSQQSLLIISMVAIGGTGTIVGPILGAGILVLLPEVLRFVGDFRLMVVGLLTILVMIFRPRGILGGYKIINKRVKI